eukprot:TRINITY_DN290_c0_g1_i9.p1 TRINITY_DN290_c0_g1~~TRINITY_DN290_c0_g1_i9.p1  ORF type:complete len:314 (-),score=68.69 TRINITY_DN290_c0_g1_i9:128-1069(-)
MSLTSAEKRKAPSCLTNITNLRKQANDRENTNGRKRFRTNALIVGRTPQDEKIYEESCFQTLKEWECFTDGLQSMVERQGVKILEHREVLINWILQVSYEEGYELQEETIFIAIDYIDRYLANVDIPQMLLQLLAITCLFIAAKYEEIFPLPLKKFMEICGGYCTRDDILKMECSVLAELEWSLVTSSLINFLSRFIKSLTSLDEEEDVTGLSKYICYKIVPSPHYRDYRVSLMAGSIVCFAIHLMNFNDMSSYSTWTPEFEQDVGATQIEVAECMKVIRERLLVQNETTEILETIFGEEYLSDLKIPSSLPF